MNLNDREPYVKRLPKGTCLRPESALSMLHAERHAYAARRPLNTFITIKFTKASRSGQGAYDVFRKKFWRNTQRRWNTIVKDARKYSPFDAIAVFEFPPTISPTGKRHYGPFHVHWMIRWPFRMSERLNYFLRRQYQREFGVAPPGIIKIGRVRNSPAAIAYLAKGIDPPFAKKLHLSPKPQGPIDHRRIIISRSLGPSARKKKKEMGYDPLPKKRKSYYKKFRKYDLNRILV